ncbi:Kdo hydroxylase family protein [Candidatus Methylocalor cossyra]|uniref:3-deoxy-D-manno-oct-2-ulosonic acid (Kdo) hydroxylase n=1 Tax=Candidatus Methylocalor cossyra TaxID=3108543 RepID=A0ABM9NHX5_9GAMM
MSLNIIRECPVDTWDAPPGEAVSEGWEEVLESGQVIYLPRLAFPLSEAERPFLSPAWSDHRAKNISLRGEGGELRGARGTPAELERLRALVARFAASATRLVDRLLPRYRGFLRRGQTSFRPHPAAGRQTSWRKDDSRLHVDSFPSNPTGGARLLRVFSNVNPHGQARIWRVGEPFERLAERFLPKTTRPFPGSAWVLERLGITKSRRTEYDHLMGQLHDLAKADTDYQALSPQQSFAFAAGSTWIVYSDQVQHAVMSGALLLEQTFYLDVAQMVRPDTAPLKVLERLTGRPLR